MNSPSSNDTVLSRNSHSETPLHHQEHFVFILVVMPDELTLQLVELYQLAIQFARDVWFPVFLDSGKLLGQVDFLNHAL